MTESTEPRRPDFAALRTEYMLKALDEGQVDPSPITQFICWFNESIAAGAREPNAMTLATSTRDGHPSARIVLLKGVDERGFVFFTNYLSRKGRDLAENPHAALVFYWSELERQVRVEGQIDKTSRQESVDYFQSRPADARFGSAASPQSEPLASRDELIARDRDLRARYPDGNVPCPEHWGGYRLRPSRLEFWQGGAGRLHDRIEYVMDASRNWIRRRLAP